MALGNLSLSVERSGFDIGTIKGDAINNIIDIDISIDILSLIGWRKDWKGIEDYINRRLESSLEIFIHYGRAIFIGLRSRETSIDVFLLLFKYSLG